MGIDAKGRNFSAPRLTPGRSHELMTYGSPAMIKDQDRQIAIMEDRARRYGYMNASSIAKYGGVTARALGTSEGYNRPPVAAQVRPAIRNSSEESAKKIIKFIVLFIVIFNVFPFIITFLIGLFTTIGNL